MNTNFGPSQSRDTVPLRGGNVGEHVVWLNEGWVRVNGQGRARDTGGRIPPCRKPEVVKTRIIPPSHFLALLAQQESNRRRPGFGFSKIILFLR
jgi:hypothetical protein